MYHWEGKYRPSGGHLIRRPEFRCGVRVTHEQTPEGREAMRQQKLGGWGGVAGCGIFPAGDQGGPNTGDGDGDICTFTLSSALACTSSVIPHNSPILQLGKLRFREMKFLIQGHPASVNLQSQGSQTPGPRCLSLPCAVFPKLPAHEVLSVLPQNCVLNLSPSSLTHSPGPVPAPSLTPGGACPSLLPGLLARVCPFLAQRPSV